MPSDAGGRRWERPDGPASSSAPDHSDAQKPKRSFGSRLVTILISVVLFAVIAGLVAAILVQQGIFNITAIDATPSEHLTSEQIAKLADIKEGTSLVSVDRGSVESNIKKNPWVKSVSIKREFPATLGISVEERVAKAVVLMNSGDKAWLLSQDNYWIEPVALDTSSGRTARSLAYERAQQLNCLFIENVPSTMSPDAGYVATDNVLEDVDEYLVQFSEKFSSQIVAFSVASESAIGCTLSNGVEISLGAPDDIPQKEAVALQILDEHKNDVTFINVRLPSKPTYRKAGVPQPTGLTPNQPTTSQESGGLLSDSYSVGNAGSNAVPSSKEGGSANANGTSVNGNTVEDTSGTGYDEYSEYDEEPYYDEYSGQWFY